MSRKGSAALSKRHARRDRVAPRLEIFIQQLPQLSPDANVATSSAWRDIPIRAYTDVRLALGSRSGRPVDLCVGAIASRVVRKMGVFFAHPNFPVVECFWAVSFDRTFEAQPPGSFDPDEIGQMADPL